MLILLQWRVHEEGSGLSDKVEEPMEDVPTRGVREGQDQTLRALMGFLMPKVRTFVSWWPQPNQ